MLALLVCTLGGATPAEPGKTVYLHNRALQGRWESGEFYIPAQELAGYLKSDEAQRVVVDESRNTVLVGGQSLTMQGRGVPMLALTRALGLRVKEANGVVDIVKTSAPEEIAANVSILPVSSGHREDYQEAKRRLDRILETLPVSADGPRQARIDKVGQRVAHFSPLGGIPWKFVLVRERAPNAACVGEGHVFVTTGLLDLGLSDDELAGVLGHEIAHGVRRHCFRRVEMARELKSLLAEYSRLQFALQDGATPSLRGQVDDYEKRRNSLQYRLDNEVFYTKLDEEEADVLGMRYAVLAGYSPDGLGDCLKLLEKFFVANFGTAILQEDLSHPPVRRRLEILEKARSSGGY